MTYLQYVAEAGPIEICTGRVLRPMCEQQRADEDQWSNSPGSQGRYFFCQVINL